MEVGLKMNENPALEQEQLIANKKQVRVEDLRGLKISPGDFYLYQPTRGKCVLQLKAGEVVDQDFIVRMTSKKDQMLMLENKIDEIWAKGLEKLLNQLKKLEGESDQQEKVLEKIQALWAADLWGSKGDIHLFDWAYTCFQVFTQGEDKLAMHLYQEQMILYWRGLYSSSLNVLFAVSCGYKDFSFLKDLYHLGWMMDLSIADGGFTYNTQITCELEKLKSGAGAMFLTKRSHLQKDLELFMQHPTMSYEKAVKNWASLLTNHELLTGILVQHARADGNGFPSKLKASDISDWEAILIMTDHLIDYQEEIIARYHTMNLKMLWKELAKFHLNDLPIKRVVKRIEKNMDYWFQQGAA